MKKEVYEEFKVKCEEVFLMWFGVSMMMVCEVFVFMEMGFGMGGLMC